VISLLTEAACDSMARRDGRQAEAAFSHIGLMLRGRAPKDGRFLARAKLIFLQQAGATTG
jgi:hypothetical protein